LPASGGLKNEYALKKESWLHHKGPPFTPVIVGIISYEILCSKDVNTFCISGYPASDISPNLRNFSRSPGRQLNSPFGFIIKRCYIDK